jgi:hypothetical protein
MQLSEDQIASRYDPPSGDPARTYIEVCRASSLGDLDVEWRTITVLEFADFRCVGRVSIDKVMALAPGRMERVFGGHMVRMLGTPKPGARPAERGAGLADELTVIRALLERIADRLDRVGGDA